MTLTLKPISIFEARGRGFEDMLALHWEETDADLMPPMAPNWAAYYDLEKRGVLKFYALLRDEQMIGYSIWFVQPTLQHRETWAINDMVYVEPEHRGWPGVFLIRQAEKLLKADGARRIVYNVKAGRAHGDFGYKRGRDTVSRLLQRLDYTLAEQVWIKRT